MLTPDELRKRAEETLREHRMKKYGPIEDRRCDCDTCCFAREVVRLIPQPALNAEGLRECPVPWCSHMNTVAVFDWSDRFGVRCNCCGLTMKLPGIFTRAEAIAKWNARPALVSDDGELLKTLIALTTVESGEEDYAYFWRDEEGWHLYKAGSWHHKGAMPEDCIRAARKAAETNPLDGK